MFPYCLVSEMTYNVSSGTLNTTIPYFPYCCMVTKLQRLFQSYTSDQKQICKSINVCMPLIVRISQVVEHRKLLWPQTFSGAFQRLVPTTCHTQYSHFSHPRIATLLESSQQNTASQRHQSNTSCTKTQKIEAAVSAEIEGRW